MLVAKVEVKPRMLGSDVTNPRSANALKYNSEDKDGFISRWDFFKAVPSLHRDAICLRILRL